MTKDIETIEGDIFVWDCHELAPVKEIVETAIKIKDAKLYESETGSGFYVCIVAKNKNDAFEIWKNSIGKEIVESVLEDEPNADFSDEIIDWNH